MYKHNDLTGNQFGRLYVIEECGRTKDRHILWKCLCECGNQKTVSGKDLINGHTKSCGCLFKDKITKHGGRTVDKTDRLYYVWRGMIKRCYYEKGKSYKYYGGRGITICDNWLDYAKFREWAIRTGYDCGAEKWKCTIDRINVNGNYEPSNCRWVSMKIQNQNKQKNAKTKMDGENSNA